MGNAGFIRKSLFMIGGLLLWAAHFTIIYIFNSLACTRQFADVEVLGIGIVPYTVTGTTLIALSATGVIFLLALWRRGPTPDARPVEDFMRYTTMTIAGLSLIAIAWNGIPALLLHPCS